MTRICGMILTHPYIFQLNSGSMPLARVPAAALLRGAFAMRESKMPKCGIMVV